MSDAIITVSVRSVKLPCGLPARYSSMRRVRLIRSKRPGVGVEAVLSGRVTKAGDQVRVTVQLVAIDNSLLWADKLDHSFTGRVYL